MIKKNLVSDSEVKKLVDIYKKLPETDRNMLVMGGNLLLASQSAKKRKSTHQKTG